jgi:predicted DNA-binding transcriptional regulator AlpA
MGNPRNEIDSSVRLLTKGEVLALIGVSYPALWGWIRDGKFPAGRSIGFGKRSHVAWVESEVAEWIANRPLRLPKGHKGYRPEQVG